MLDCQLLALLREVEHIEDDGFCATVLSMVYGVHHLHDSLAFVNDFLFTILTNDGQLALHQDAVVHYRMVVPAEFLTGREDILHSYPLGTSYKVVGQLHAVPALTGANKFFGYYLWRRVVVCFCFLT